MKTSRTITAARPSLNFDPQGNTVLVTAFAETGKDFNCTYEGYKKMEFYSKIRKCPDGWYIESKIIILEKLGGEKKRWTTHHEQFLAVSDRHLTLLYALAELEHQWWQHLYSPENKYKLSKIHNTMMNRLNKQEISWIDDNTIRLDKKEIFLEKSKNITTGTVYRDGCVIAFVIDTKPKEKK